jgi:hypothetical protein
MSKATSRAEIEQSEVEALHTPIRARMFCLYVFLVLFAFDVFLTLVAFVTLDFFTLVAFLPFIIFFALAAFLALTGFFALTFFGFALAGLAFKLASILFLSVHHEDVVDLIFDFAINFTFIINILHTVLSMRHTHFTRSQQI